jgi:hypothetical protein
MIVVYLMFIKIPADPSPTQSGYDWVQVNLKQSRSKVGIQATTFVEDRGKLRCSLPPKS